MSEEKVNKYKLGQFGRNLSLMFNRATMYDSNHPYVKQSIDVVYDSLTPILKSLSPLVFIMNREQFFIDEEPLDPRVNVGRIVTHFKKTGLQSISFEEGVEKNELRAFLEIISALSRYPDVDAMKKALNAKGALGIKINHVLYKKVTEDDEVVSKEALKKAQPEIMDEEEVKTKKMFMDALLESVLSEEFAKTLTIENLVSNPVAFSKSMIEADLKEAKNGGAGALEPGQEQGSRVGSSPGPGPGQGQGSGVGSSPGPGASQGQESGVGSGPGPGPGQGAGIGAGLEASLNQGQETVVVSDQGQGPGEDAGLGMGHGQGQGPGGDVAPAIASGQNQGVVAIPGHGLGPGTGPGAGPDSKKAPGHLLLQQLHKMDQEVADKLSGNSYIDLPDLAKAVYEMKKQLIADMESQKALGVSYSHEEMILEKTNEITDKVLIRLIKEEYQAGKISTSRLAQILRRLIPEVDELKRLLPKIKEALLEEGMPMKEYLSLVQDLGKELQSEELTKILEESAEEIGIEGDDLIEEVKQRPTEAAELIYLASEIRKGTGDEKVLTELLVDYVERLGSEKALETASENDGKGEEHLRNVISKVESDIVGQLGKMDVKDDVLNRLEERLNDRIEDILDNLKLEWFRSQSDSPNRGKVEKLSVLQTLERSVSENDELGKILMKIRTKAEAKEIDENDFREIYSEIIRQKQIKKAKESQRVVPETVLKSKTLKLILEKEIARAKRYDSSFGALAFSLVKAKPKVKAKPGAITNDSLTEALLYKLSIIFRDADIVGQLGKNKVVAILPMTPEGEAKLALRRVMKLLNLEPLMVNEIPVEVNIAGIATTFVPEQASDAKAFIKILSDQLVDMSARIKNIHAFS